MLFGKLGELTKGYHIITSIGGQYGDMLMDVGIYKMAAGQEEMICEEEKESALLLLDGVVRIEWEGNTEVIKRNCVFEQEPYCLHIPKDAAVKLTAMADSEVLVQKTRNENTFESKLYKPETCQSVVAGEGIWGGTAQRVIRTIFDYDTAPYSNMVMGEVISYPGRWSSYPPHHHEQPEVYYYRFNKQQGFGCAMIGEHAYRVVHNSYVAIPGNLDHPQTAAPGYAMYYCWMIPHLKGRPWTQRIMEKEHEWLLEPNAKIWPEKEV